MLEPITIVGSAHARKGDFASAIADFTKVIQLESNNVKAYYSRGLFCWVKDEVDRAIADFTKVIALDPDSADAYYYRGIAWLCLGEQEKARADLTAARNMGVELPSRGRRHVALTSPQ